MQRIVAQFIYLFALVVGLGALGSGFSHGLWSTMMAIASAIVIWWLAVGFGVRMGVTPDDFVSSLKRLLGFGVEWDTPKEPAPQDSPPIP